ncbi:MAG: SDR family oxidoreductase, partial [Pseudomonadota bacterium]
GAIVNTASVWGRSAPAGFSGYAASKHAVIGLTRAWSRELAPRRIRVNAVCPGWVGTDAALRSLGAMAKQRGVPPAMVQAEIEATQDIPGLMTPEDVASLYLFLASPAAANITGQAVNVDRGELQA